MRKPLLLCCITGILAFTMIGCNNAEQKQQAKETSSSHQHHTEKQRDIAETTKGIDTLPSFLSEQDAQIKKIYAVAGQHAELLQWIPCYCGCGESVGHKSNKNCFIREIKKDGQVVWDSHATTCVNCLEIVLEAARLQDKGKSPLEIRKYIDNKYKEGYAKPTPTPMPKA
ncbi:PCYCGC motif-containing (lipo)protein [Bacillus sp. 123MFChir2]|uniref:PCYCGC motif-containing (lipo)protein n=1 Tax=Bacillus sp. 123MFChir2 TaxID=1169144 RepID=UPI00036791C3|nr:PCYCGC motif-containing (lipo)protein [Bacillus sp. 123MFChir2]